MIYALPIVDKTSSGEVIANTVIQFPVETVTVKALIEMRVQQEVEKLQAKGREKFFTLVTPNDAEESLNGVRLRKGQRLDVAEQQAIAIEAFEQHGFFLLVNDKQLTRLDDTITITPNSQVVFFKLIPVVGG